MDLELLFGTATLTADLAMNGNDLATDNTLKTSLIISIFTDRRAEPDDVLPDDTSTGGNAGTGDRRGWWGDWYSPDALQAIEAGTGTLPVPVDRIGSRLWLLGREKQLSSVLARAKEYIEEAVAWMLEDQVAKEIDVTTEISAPGVLGFEIDLIRPDGTPENYRFQYAWGGL